ncbi:MAG: FAD-binding oxidoreductase [Bacteroidia bacterium]|nr:FAD-binding oxidoreductase [Bacteroidia bacterium]
MGTLVSNISYWEKASLLNGFDFIIVGNGLIGSQIAIKLKKKYSLKKIGLLDRSPFSAGASTRNAGFACFGSITELMSDCKYSSESDVSELAEKRFKGISLLRSEFGDKNIGYKATGAWEIFTSRQEKDYENAFDNIHYYNKLLENVTGEKETYQAHSTSQFGFNDSGNGLLNKAEGQLDTGMLYSTIAKTVSELGIIPLYGLTISSYKENNTGVTIQTSEGYQLHCERLILATNAFTKNLLPSADIVPARGQILITKPFEKVPFKGTFHSESGYIYFRNVGDRILIGGGRNNFIKNEETHSIENSKEVTVFLENYLREFLLPGIPFKIDMQWSGIMAMGKQNKMPMVENISDRVFACVRMGGMGVSLGPVLAVEVCNLVSNS